MSGGWVAEADVRVSGNEQGFFSASCLQHGGNFGFESSPIVNGVTMQEALSNWFFERGDAEMKYTADMCAEVSSGGSGKRRQRYRYYPRLGLLLLGVSHHGVCPGLPCTVARGKQRCPHWSPTMPYHGVVHKGSCLSS